MDRYLKKLEKLNQKIKDPAEFSNFTNSAKAFLETTENHEQYVKPIEKALNRQNSTYVTKTVYEIASFINVPSGFIDQNILERDFRNKLVRSSMLRYFLKFGIDSFDDKIKKKLRENKLHMDQSVFEFFKQRFYITKEFMFSAKTENIFVQLDLMINSHIFYNARNFIQYLGSSSGLIAFKAYEAFNNLFQAVIADTSSIILDKFSIRELFDCGHIHKSNLILNIEKLSLNIASLNNFLIFGSCFLKERNEIYRILNMADYNESIYSLEKLVSHYFSNIQDRNIIIQPHDPCSLVKTKSTVQRTIEDNESFNYLFKKKYRKDICDCYEF